MSQLLWAILFKKMFSGIFMSSIKLTIYCKQRNDHNVMDSGGDYLIRSFIKQLL